MISPRSERSPSSRERCRGTNTRGPTASRSPPKLTQPTICSKRLAGLPPPDQLLQALGIRGGLRKRRGLVLGEDAAGCA
jgi:hypothetical protein